VVATGSAETMLVQRYDVRLSADAGDAFEERFWLPVNSPVLAECGAVELIVHRVNEAAAKANQRHSHPRQHHRRLLHARSAMAL
jgi:hypothetical protein